MVDGKILAACWQLYAYFLPFALRCGVCLTNLCERSLFAICSRVEHVEGLRIINLLVGIVLVFHPERYCLLLARQFGREEPVVLRHVIASIVGTVESGKILAAGVCLEARNLLELLFREPSVEWVGKGECKRCAL